MAQITQQIDPADLVARISTDKEGRRVLEVTSRQGFNICRNHPIENAPDFEAALLEMLRPFGLEGEAPEGSTLAHVRNLERELDRLETELDALRGAGVVVASSGAEPHELPALAQRISDGEAVPTDDVERFVVGVLETAGELGDEVAGRVARVFDFVSRELAPIVKDVPPPTPPDRKPVPTVIATPATSTAPATAPAPVVGRRPFVPPAAAPAVGRRPNPPVIPAIPKQPIVSPQARANLEFLASKQAAAQPSQQPPAQASAELRATAEKVLRGETLDLTELRAFVDGCRFVELDEHLSNAFTEAQEHLKSVEG